MKKISLVILFSLFISVSVILPFFHSGYFPTHDGEWTVVRLTDMFRTLRDFQIPVRFSGALNFGYGYPLFNFAYPFPYYIGVFIHFLGIGFVDTIKILFAGSVFLSAIFMFLAAEALWKKTLAGIVCATLYIYFPYRMVDLYVRGSIGESLSFALFPLLIYLGVKLVEKPSFLLIAAIAFSIGILITAHNIMSVFFIPFFILFVITKIIFEKKKNFRPFIVSIFLGFGLSAFFWIPALFEKNNILLSKIPIADRSLYFVSLSQLIFPRWGYGVPTDPNGFSYQLGLAHLTIFILVILFLLFLLIKDKKYFTEYYIKIAGILTIFTVFFVFLLFKPSEFLWKNIPLLSEINYPWTVLGILGFSISLLAGFLSRQILGKYVVVFLGAIAIFTVLPYAKPEYYFNKGDDYYLTNDATTTSSNELMPLWVKKMPNSQVAEKVEIIKGNGKIANIYFNSKEINFSVNLFSDGVVRINTIYYPGWKVSVDKTNTVISYSNEKGVMDLSIPSGKHLVKANFTETLFRATSNTISLLSVSALLFLGLKGFRSFLSNPISGKNRLG